MKTWTADEIQVKIETDQKWLERAIVAIYNRQTTDEKQSEQTKHHNGVGFTGADAHFLTYCATYILSGRTLSGNFIPKARKRMVKYCRQLEELTKIPVVTPTFKKPTVLQSIANLGLPKEETPYASFDVKKFLVSKSEGKTTFIAEASDINFNIATKEIIIQGKLFYLTTIDRNNENEIEGWNYKSSDDFYALIIND